MAVDFVTKMNCEAKSLLEQSRTISSQVDELKFYGLEGDTNPDCCTLEFDLNCTAKVVYVALQYWEFNSKQRIGIK